MSRTNKAEPLQYVRLVPVYAFLLVRGFGSCLVLKVATGPVKDFPRILIHAASCLKSCAVFCIAAEHVFEASHTKKESTQLQRP